MRLPRATVPTLNKKIKTRIRAARAERERVFFKTSGLACAGDESG
jgi:hypothetical protein